jgi:hypothetical protein
MKPTMLFSIARVSLLIVVAKPAQLNEHGVSTPENNGEPDHRRGKFCIGRLSHHLQCLLDTSLGDHAQEGRLLQLNGKSLTQRPVEDRIAGGIDEVRKHQYIFVRERFGLRALPKEDSARCQKQHGDGSDGVVQQSDVPCAGGERSCVRFQELRTFV